MNLKRLVTTSIIGLALFLGTSEFLSAQLSSRTAFRVRRAASAPAACIQGDVYFNTTSAGFYICTATNTFTILSTGSGVTATGTPVDNQIAVWDSASSIEGDSNLTWSGSVLGVTGSLTLSTDLTVPYGGTGVSTFTDGGVLLGSGASAITATAVLGDGEILIGDASTDPVALDVGSSTAITILGTVATGTWQATDIGVPYGGTGVSTFTDGGVLLGSAAAAVTATAVLTNGQLLIGDGTGDPALATITAVANETTVTNGAGTITIGIVDPLAASKGGSGAASFTDGGLLLGSGSGTFTALGVATNGQIPIGDGTGDPTLAVITGTTNEVDITNGSGTIQVGLPSNVQVGGTLGVTGVWTMTDATASIGGIAYEFPPDDGDSGEQLQTDGSGTLTWEAGGSGGGGNVSNTGTPANNQIAIWTAATTIEGDSDLTFDGTDLTIGGDLIVSGYGPHIFGGPLVDYYRLALAGPFTSGGAATYASLLDVGDVLTGASGDTNNLTQVSINGAIITQTATETIAAISSLRVAEPGITDNLTGDITVASTLHVLNAPTEGEDNYALLVGSGDSKFGGELTTNGLEVYRSDGTTQMFDLNQADGFGAFGGSRNDRFAFQFSGAGSAAVSTAGAGPHAAVMIETPVTGEVNDSFAGLISSPQFTEAGSLTHAVVAGVWANNFSVTNAGAAVTDVAGFYAPGAPTATGARAYSMLLAAGAVRFGAVGTNDGHVHILSPATGTRGLVVEVPASSSVEAILVQYNGSTGIILDSRANINNINLAGRDLGNNNEGPNLLIGRNTNSTQASGGFIGFYDIGNQVWYLHADDSGLLRIGTTIPVGTADTTNTIVGTQSSFQFHSDGNLNKIKIRDITPQEGFDVITKSRFTIGKYADGAYNDGEFIWPYAEESPWLMQDPNERLPGGRSHSPISHASLNSLAIQALSQQIEVLKNEIETLKHRGRSGLDVAGIQ